jgi:hypothetical protein
MEGFGRIRRVWYVMNGFRRVWDDPDYVRKSGGFPSRCILVPLRGKEFPLWQIRILQRRVNSSRFPLAESYLNTSKLWGWPWADLMRVSTYKHCARGAPRVIPSRSPAPWPHLCHPNPSHDTSLHHHPVQSAAKSSTPFRSNLDGSRGGSRSSLTHFPLCWCAYSHLDMVMLLPYVWIPMEVLFQHHSLPAIVITP